MSLFKLVKTLNVKNVKVKSECELIDENNKIWVDFNCDNGAISFGYETQQKFLKKINLIHFSNIFKGDKEDVANFLSNEINFPSYVAFGLGGSQANEIALKVIHRQKKIGQKYIYALKDVYYGDTYGALSLEKTSSKYHKKGFDVSVRNIKWFNWKKITSYIQQKKLDEIDWKKVIAFFVTPSHVYHNSKSLKKLMKMIYEKCKENNVLFVVDEIQTGFFRMPKYYLQILDFGIEPDIVTIGKGFGNGVPISACLVSNKIVENYEKENDEKLLQLGSTYNTHFGYNLGVQALKYNLQLISNKENQEKIDDNAKIFYKYMKKISSSSYVKRVNLGYMQSTLEMMEKSKSLEMMEKMIEKGYVCDFTWAEKKIFKFSIPFFTDEKILKEYFDFIVNFLGV